MALTATLLICLLAASWPLPYIVAVESSCTHQHLIDITVTTRTGTPVFGSPNGLPRIWRSLISSIADGDDYNESWLNLDAHIGTHVDAPGHFLHKAYTNGPTVDQLDLNVLMGPVLVVEVPENSNITGKVLASLDIPKKTQRIIFKTRNTKKELMFQTAFDTSYTAMDLSGAKWITQHTDVKLVGIDYLSIAVFDNTKDPHVTLFQKGVIAVEGLDLRSVEPGSYYQICLPAKYGGSDGAPVRCVLMPQNWPQCKSSTHSEL
eukprot:jgi/Chrzof1/8540/Cz03g14260.t1